jgi:hypothetical protein
VEKHRTALAPNDATIRTVSWFGNATDITTSMRAMPTNEPIVDSNHVSCLSDKYLSHEKGGIGIGSYGGWRPGSL